MSYLVLARKWRPQGFNDLIGQEPVVRILTNSILQGKTVHAYVFSGPRGVGKTSMARILAKALNCEKAPTAEPCGSCPSCASIADGYAVDVIEIDGASNNSVDDVRDLRERVKYAPSTGRCKVYIIDESHMLSTPAFNALLKTLEEPPSHVVFILATTEPRKILPTVMSRCQHLPFRRVPTRLIKERLRHIAGTEGINASDGALGLIARAADGSIRDSLTILDQAVSFSPEVKEADIKALLGVIDFMAVVNMVKALIDGDRRLILEAVAELDAKGTDMRAFAKDITKLLRDLIVTKVLYSKSAAPADYGEVLDASEEEFASMKGLAEAVSEEHLSLLLSESLKCESDIRNSSAPRVAFEMSLIKLSYLGMFKPVSEAIAALENKKGRAFPHDEGASAAGMKKAETPEKSKENKTNPPEAARKRENPIHKAAPPVAPVEEAVPLEIEEAVPPEEDIKAPSVSPGNPALTADSVLEALIERIDDLMVGGELQKAKAQLDGDTLTLTLMVGAETAYLADPVKNNCALISDIASEVRGLPTAVEIIVEQPVPPPSKKELKDRIMSEPMVKEALSLFDGRVVDVKQVDDKEKGRV